MNLHSFPKVVVSSIPIFPVKKVENLSYKLKSQEKLSFVIH